jgi:hypothetical protein
LLIKKIESEFVSFSVHCLRIIKWIFNHLIHHISLSVITEYWIQNIHTIVFFGFIHEKSQVDSEESNTLFYIESEFVSFSVNCLMIWYVYNSSHNCVGNNIVVALLILVKICHIMTQRSWSYGSWIYNYLCNRCLSPLMLWVWTLNPIHGEVYSIKHYVIKFVSDLRQKVVVNSTTIRPRRLKVS